MFRIGVVLTVAILVGVLIATVAPVLARGDTTITLTWSPNPALSGRWVTFTANVTAVSPAAGTPTGTVTFYDGTKALGTGTLDSSGHTTYTPTTLSDGDIIKAAYSGDSNFDGSLATLPPFSFSNPVATGSSTRAIAVGLLIAALLAAGLLVYLYLLSTGKRGTVNLKK